MPYIPQSLHTIVQPLQRQGWVMFMPHLRLDAGFLLGPTQVELPHGDVGVRPTKVTYIASEKTQMRQARGIRIVVRTLRSFGAFYPFLMQISPQSGSFSIAIALLTDPYLY